MSTQSSSDRARVEAYGAGAYVGVVTTSGGASGSGAATSPSLNAAPVPSATMRPSRMRTSRGDRAAIAGSCVMTRTVWPTSELSRRRIPRISRPVRESRFPVGSSARITRGLLERARAMATRCCSPPESWLGRWCARSRSPTPPSSARARSRRTLRRLPRGARAASTFSAAVSVGTRLNCWKTKPNARRRRSARLLSPSFVMSRPSKCTAPAVGRSSAPSSCSNVVLPDPLGPSMTKNSPLSMRSEMPSTARTSLAPWLNALTTSSSSNTAPTRARAARQPAAGARPGPRPPHRQQGHRPSRGRRRRARS